MINSAIQNGFAGEILPVADIARRLVELTGLEAKKGASAMGNGEKKKEEEKELAIDELDLSQLQGDDQPGIVSGFTCPECHGALWELTASDSLRFRCRVGHAYAVDSLLVKQQDSIEAAFWVALRALEERGALLRRLAQRAEKIGHGSSLARYNAEAQTVAANAKTIRDIILSGILSDDPESSAP
jgi:two-component system chemotaxis response regulator CheB